MKKLKHLIKEFTVIEQPLKTIVEYRHNYNDHCADNMVTFYIYDENIIDILESNISPNVISYKKLSKNKKEMYKELIKEMNRITCDLIDNIQTFTYEKNTITNEYDIVSGLIKAHNAMFYRCSLFSKVISYIHTLEKIQKDDF